MWVVLALVLIAWVLICAADKLTAAPAPWRAVFYTVISCGVAQGAAKGNSALIRLQIYSACAAAAPGTGKYLVPALISVLSTMEPVAAAN